MEGWGTNETIGERRRVLASEGTCWEKNLNLQERTGLLAIEGDFLGANGLLANEVERWTTKKNVRTQLTVRTRTALSANEVVF